MTTEQLTQFLTDNGIEPTIDNLVTCLCDRWEKFSIERTKRAWRVWLTDTDHFDATGSTPTEATLQLMVLLEMENEKTTEDYLYNYNLNK
jgi:hypothetical protein